MTAPDFSRILQSIQAQAALRGAIPVAGGSTHAAWRIDSSTGSFFLKLDSADHLPQFLAEADGLQRIAATGTVRVPQVLAHGQNATHAWLALEWLDLQAIKRDAGTALARQLAELHACSSEHFGLESDNYIGRTQQANAPERQWPQFFARKRLQPQLDRARQQGMECKLYETGTLLAEKLPAFFVDRRVQPSLLHGDLWSGNAAMLADGTPVLFDPATYFGDAEADLAMAELFGGFPESFYAEYRRARPLAFGYEQRKTLYNLYHMLNHFNLFGASYLSQVTRMIEALAAELRH